LYEHDVISCVMYVSDNMSLQVSKINNKCIGLKTGWFVDDAIQV